jgi:hypothetical protein
MNQVFINISLPKHIRSRKTYMNKFSGKQTRFSEGALSLVVCQALGTSCQTQNSIEFDSVPSSRHAQENVHLPWHVQNNGYSPLAHRRKTYMRVTFLMEVNYL